jgi:hypothetical protein
MGVLKWLLGTTLALKIVDIVTTYYLVYLYSITIESNPLIYDMIQAYGLGYACFINMFIYSILVYLLYKYQRRNLLIITIIFMSLVVFTNIAHLLMLG